jgi:hypothetical protein
MLNGQHNLKARRFKNHYEMNRKRRITKMKKMMTGVLVFLIAITLGAGAGFAGNGKRNGGGDRDRKKDGSCTSYSIDGNIQLNNILAKDQTRDRKKDGSCKS